MLGVVYRSGGSPKQSAIGIIAEVDSAGVVTKSKLQKGQIVRVLTFSGSTTQVIDFTDDVQQLVNAILAIERGGSSTDLNGAIVQGMNALSNTYTFEKITVGAMVMITDGNDTASRSTEAAAIAAVGEKLLFAVPVGEEATATANLASL